MKTRERPFVLSIAGLDPCGGAGILADIKTFEQLKVSGMTVMTANTLQTEDHFYELHWQATADICRHLRVLMQQYPIDVVKIGIVKDAVMLQEIVRCIRKHSEKAFITWDPVLKSSTGHTFFEGIDDMVLADTLQAIDLITPNISEHKLLEPFLPNAKAILLKGGHSKDKPGLDLLYLQEQLISLPPNMKQAYAKHGSGCVLSAAIAAYIARGNAITEACRLAKIYVEQFLNSHPTLLGYHHHAE